MFRDITVKLYVYGNVMPGEFPRIEVQPVVRNLYLVSVNNFLSKDTVFVTQAITPRRVVHCSHAIQETCGQTTKTAVSQRCVVLLRYDVLNPKAEIFETS